SRATDGNRFFSGVRQLSRSHCGMVMVQLGVSVTVFGIAFSQNYRVERYHRIKSADSVEINMYHINLRKKSRMQDHKYS
ncbi:heme lyase NrfEFG subunit NrfE, partial [Erwinia amylovora]|uniref:cytochrome c-type biogenesis CcmF C-terminal domain-containing protein n=1 Tax=Erwinia amylovora TaxID=552 RepID=UPI0026E57FC5